VGQASLREATLEFSGHGRGPLDETRRELRDRENAEAIGGMRNPKQSISKLPGLETFGGWLNQFLEEFIGRHTVLKTCVAKIRAGQPEPFPSAIIKEARDQLAKALGTTIAESQESPLCSSLLRSLASWTDDPDAALLADWLEHGAPIGILHPITSTGVFPKIDPEHPPTPLSELFTAPGEETSHKSAEQDLDISTSLLREAEDKGFARIFESRYELEEFLQTSQVVFNPLGLISKLKPDGSWKHRLIWDLLRSRVNESVHQGERIVLPMLADVVEDALQLLRTADEDEDVEMLIVDISDAFNNIPVR